MKKLKLKIKKLTETAKMPIRGTANSAGLDLYCTSRKEVGHNLYIYGCGLAFEIPKGYAGFVFPRSSVYKVSALLTNCVGVIDSDYRGEVKAVMHNRASDGYQVGERFAQLVILPVPAVDIEEVDELSATERGAGGYGSTGK